ncbi:hypothetical protein C2G38_2196888 [Gigaspora rosea]|uniref:BHLH domain-containing protein n=1 Tax=Gigaspora rosea TaxID=44941 RepID=A0A397UVZ4_9GLOM|nr:hypothetical protein C2G38_2196888 [Gigaspora rosea]
MNFNNLIQFLVANPDVSVNDALNFAHLKSIDSVDNDFILYDIDDNRPIGDMQLEIFNQSLFESEEQWPYNENFNATIGYSSTPDHIDAQLNISEFIEDDININDMPVKKKRRTKNIDPEEYRNIKVGEEKKRRETIAQGFIMLKEQLPVTYSKTGNAKLLKKAASYIVQREKRLKNLQLELNQLKKTCDNLNTELEFFKKFLLSRISASILSNQSCFQNKRIRKKKKKLEKTEGKDKNRSDKKEDYYSKVTNLLKANDFNIETLEKFPKYSIIKVSFKEYFYYLIIWHDRIKDKQHYLDFYDEIQFYIDNKRPNNPIHNNDGDAKDDHLIVCQSSGIKYSYIEKYEHKTEKFLPFYHCEENNWIIKHIKEYFSE